MKEGKNTLPSCVISHIISDSLGEKKWKQRWSWWWHSRPVSRTVVGISYAFSPQVTWIFRLPIYSSQFFFPWSITNRNGCRSSLFPHFVIFTGQTRRAADPLRLFFSLGFVFILLWVFFRLTLERNAENIFGKSTMRIRSAERIAVGV